ncbi:uncharacterized protein LOC122247352 [Penaeus japonicus]|uniref:uncharacterized protein LOC122247352 n=1 Tax=Penaeus japonicus TaxID=27405 RepID=UPI001C713FE6|nr:uncharacterized protein LOC122247352 [Penaeus japonicus]
MLMYWLCSVLMWMVWLSLKKAKTKTKQKLESTSSDLKYQPYEDLGCDVLGRDPWHLRGTTGHHHCLRRLPLLRVRRHHRRLDLQEEPCSAEAAAAADSAGLSGRNRRELRDQRHLQQPPGREAAALPRGASAHLSHPPRFQPDQLALPRLHGGMQRSLYLPLTLDAYATTTSPFITTISIYTTTHHQELSAIAPSTFPSSGTSPGNLVRPAFEVGCSTLRPRTIARFFQCL